MISAFLLLVIITTEVNPLHRKVVDLEWKTWKQYGRSMYLQVYRIQSDKRSITSGHKNNSTSYNISDCCTCTIQKISLPYLNILYFKQSLLTKNNALHNENFDIKDFSASRDRDNHYRCGLLQNKDVLRWFVSLICSVPRGIAVRNSGPMFRKLINYLENDQYIKITSHKIIKCYHKKNNIKKRFIKCSYYKIND